MRKTTCLIAMVTCLVSCKQNSEKYDALQLRVDSLEKKLNTIYQPGLGEFMSSIQVHHAKLWFAGKSENWKLAEFEMSEIMETIEAVQKSNIDKKESDKLPMLVPAINNLNIAISKKDPATFRSGFSLLTKTCNDCHQATGHPVNVIQVPENLPFSNQVY
jgi:hypothetical protein